MKKPEIHVITGPTAVGKTVATVAFAKKNNLSVVSFDSRQFYKEPSIGTAKPTAKELDGVPHYFIDSHSLSSPLTAGTFEEEAIPLINKLVNEQGSVILTGGSGMYMDALLKGIEPKPEVPRQVTTALLNKLDNEGLEALAQELQLKDPDYAEKVDLSNSRRVIRALEVMRTTGKTFSSFQTGVTKDRPWEANITVLNRDRDELYNRINTRVDLMMIAGLEQEARSLIPYKHLPIMQTVGYQELFPYFKGEYTIDRAVELIKRNSRRYAKRQLTWFRKLENATWMHPDEFMRKFNLDS